MNPADGPAPLPPLTDIHLWPEPDGHLRWWHADATGRLLDPLAADDATPEAAVHALLSVPAIETALRRGRVLLRLEDTLLSGWQQLPWETSSFAGLPLIGRLLAVRHAPDPLDRALPPTRSDTAILDFWPPTEPAQPFQGLAGGSVRTYQGAAGRYFVNAGDFSALTALVVIAHGNRRSGLPFEDERGNGWELPPRPCPPLVALLACGGEDGHLLDIGRSLLSQGARTVLAPAGVLSAPQAGAFLRCLLGGWRDGRSVGPLLLNRQRRGNTSHHGADRLRLLGQADLRVTASPDPAEWPEARLAHEARRELLAEEHRFPALSALLQRRTRRGWREHPDTPLEAVLSDLRADLNLHDASRSEGEARLLSALRSCEGTLPRLTRQWVVGLMAYLAEAHDHALLPWCERTRHQLDVGLTRAPTTRLHWSKLYYREGRYGEALREIAAGLSEPARQAETQTGLLGGLMNILIDLNLPDPAHAVLDQLEDALEGGASPELLRQRHNRLDRAARLALRQGQPTRALGNYRRKREEAQAAGRDGVRELSWLLYVSAWQKRINDNGLALATEARNALAAPSADFGPGNADALYLLRALALWVWRSADEATAGAVEGHLEAIQFRLATQDPGPTGMTLAFLLLDYQRRGESPQPRLADLWDEAREQMERQGYWLELAALHYLLAQPVKREYCLDRFQTRRRKVGLEGLPSSVTGLTSMDWAAILAARERLERQALSGNVSVAGLTDSGLIPL